VLEDANVKLASVATNALGKSGRPMLEDIITGEDDPEHLASVARQLSLWLGPDSLTPRAAQQGTGYSHTPVSL
jgi:hypothetical protein